MKFGSLNFFAIILGVILLGACSRGEAQPIHPLIQTVIVRISATPRPTATPTRTPLPTFTPTHTPTPTPTALPIAISGDPFANLVAEPVSQVGAQCGFVDYFDFPIDPPDAEFGRGGGDFGVYRSRYQSNHAGEDWGYQTGENLGQPVYVIGHGMVTYSQPYGWGLDQGTVIVRHTFRDGRVVYSFYGHLDPPSVVLRPGTCLVRGDAMGNIGDPSGRPHLHFEIRLHNPDTPGPGYWSVDPALAGWFPPSQTIWETRIAGQPGTIWARFPIEGSKYVGTLGSMVFVIEEGELRALDTTDGRVIWRMELETSFPSVLLAPEAGLVYVADPLGRLKAFTLPTSDMMAEWNNTKVVLDLAWEQNLGVNGSPMLMPLPGDGVVMALRQTTRAFSPDGNEVWEADGLFAISDWEIVGPRLLVSTGGEVPRLWSANKEGIDVLADGVGGQFIETEGQIFVYAPEGVYRLEGDIAEHIYAFGRGSGLGNIILRPEGGILIVHPDLSGARLLAFSATGELEWERALRGVSGSQARLVRAGEDVFLITEENQSSAMILHLYRVDLLSLELVEVFRGGTRTAVRGSAWIEALDSSRILIQIGGGHMVAWAVPE